MAALFPTGITRIEAGYLDDKFLKQSMAELYAIPATHRKRGMLFLVSGSGAERPRWFHLPTDDLTNAGFEEINIGGDYTVAVKNWAANTDYALYELVVHNGGLLRCVAAHKSGVAFVLLPNWEELGGKDFVRKINGITPNTDGEAEIKADDISFDNALTSLVSGAVQSAICELLERIEDLEDEARDFVVDPIETDEISDDAVVEGKLDAGLRDKINGKVSKTGDKMTGKLSVEINGNTFSVENTIDSTLLSTDADDGFLFNKGIKVGGDVKGTQIHDNGKRVFSPSNKPEAEQVDFERDIGGLDVFTVGEALDEIIRIITGLAPIVPPTPITIGTIPASIQPSITKTPTFQISTSQWVGNIVWSPNVAAGTAFAPEEDYVASITIIPAGVFTLDGIAANLFETAVPGAAVSYLDGVVTITYPRTEVLPIIPSGGWEMVFTTPNQTQYNIHRIPLANWAGWDGGQVLTDALYFDYANPSDLPVNMYAKYLGTPPDADFVLVPFDNWGGASGVNTITEWGFDSATNSVYITGSSGGGVFELKLVWEG